VLSARLDRLRRLRTSSRLRRRRAATQARSARRCRPDGSVGQVWSSRSRFPALSGWVPRRRCLVAVVLPHRTATLIRQARRIRPGFCRRRPARRLSCRRPPFAVRQRPRLRSAACSGTARHPVDQQQPEQPDRARIVAYGDPALARRPGSDSTRRPQRSPNRTTCQATASLHGSTRPMRRHGRRSLTRLPRTA
jgi:hypothetical protein